MSNWQPTMNLRWAHRTEHEWDNVEDERITVTRTVLQQQWVNMEQYNVPREWRDVPVVEETK